MENQRCPVCKFQNPVWTTEIYGTEVEAGIPTIVELKNLC